jgi:3',5'-cyclic AMP phosphodiesterase CpdA
VTGRVLHLSDLHVGAHDAGREAVEDAVRSLAEELDPELVVASGDLTHRNQPAQHERAAAFLRSLGRPVLAVPGNHDIPMLPPARLTRPFAAFKKAWGETEPAYRSERLSVVGVNSVRGWLYQEGAVRMAQLERVARELAAAAPGALRVVVLHHHLCSAPWRTAKRPVFKRSRVLAALERAGADLVLSGHVHQSSIVGREEFETAPEGVRALVVATAPGLGRPRPHRRGEASGLHVYELDDDAVRARTFAVATERLNLVAERSFPTRTSDLANAKM